jgi:hypothetical protein
MPDQPDRSAGIECPKFVCAAQPTVCSESSIIEGRITSNLTEPHGLRKAAGRLLAKAGATAKRIMSVLGHTTLAEAEHYTEEADQAGLAEDAVIKLEGRRTELPKPLPWVWGKRRIRVENQNERSEAGAP